MEQDFLWKTLYLCLESELNERQFGALLSRYGTLSGIEDALASATLPTKVISPISEMLAAFNRDKSAYRKVDNALSWSLAENHHLICYEDLRYPALLREIPDPPPIIYVIGNVDLLNSPQVSIIGSRRASSYGLGNARWISEELCRLDLTITSGLAMGIDSEAHLGALAVEGRTIGVTGTGADVCYPKRNRSLYKAIEQQGAILSDYPLGTPPLPSNFPRRNRLISGMSLGVLVVEAALKSGSLITARLAMEQNREVFAIPGQIHNPQAEGCHRLITEGVKLVQRAQDITEELPGIELHLDINTTGLKLRDFNNSELTSGDLHDLKRLVNLLKATPHSIDSLVIETGFSIDRLLTILADLESMNQVALRSGIYSYVPQSQNSVTGKT